MAVVVLSGMVKDTSRRIFQDTVYNNIAMGRTDATREEVYEAARKARCYDFIMELPDGFDTV
ncbi:MAG: hypothetical protein V8R55_05665, partial [Dysosmobacter sp.]